MTRIEVGANTKGAIGESLVLGNRAPPEPIVDELFGFLSELDDVGENPRPTARVRRDVYFNATDEDGEKMIWQADGRITIEWTSQKAQQEVDHEFAYHDTEAVFPVDVKTGPHARLERDQLEVARAIAKTPNNVFPTVIGVTIDDLPETFDVNTKIIGRDFN
ncbi:hypothetical protein [Halobacterium sp. R2-5]|uniref:hypothetical protein n=1 Tax=Halobacterium sp. R2-5 TaxID=2715751 RepID=UPI00141F18AD|nr:hypothetical protein [Halobacterium sp. R2-5]NIC00918.1 hypothetical protein [Halobacterium sp. R2-5]